MDNLKKKRERILKENQSRWEQIKFSALGGLELWNSQLTLLAFGGEWVPEVGGVGEGRRA